MALSASSITLDVTNTATKTIAPQNDLFRNVSIKHQPKLAATLNLMHHDGILVHSATRFFDSGPGIDRFSLEFCRVVV
jgi:hypothetical protein